MARQSSAIMEATRRKVKKSADALTTDFFSGVVTTRRARVAAWGRAKSQRVAGSIAELKAKSWGRQLDFLARMKLGWFMLSLGAYCLAVKLITWPLVYLTETSLPEILSPLFSVRPLEWLAELPATVMPGTLGTLLVLAVAFPLLVTALAQYLPLHQFRTSVPRRWLRLVISMGVTGLLYTVAFGGLGFFVAGAALALPLVFCFHTWSQRTTPLKASLVTGGVHALANASIVLLLFAVQGSLA